MGGKRRCGGERGVGEGGGLTVPITGERKSPSPYTLLLLLVTLLLLSIANLFILAALPTPISSNSSGVTQSSPTFPRFFLLAFGSGGMRQRAGAAPHSTAAVGILFFLFNQSSHRITSASSTHAHARDVAVTCTSLFRKKCKFPDFRIFSSTHATFCTPPPWCCAGQPCPLLQRKPPKRSIEIMNSLKRFVRPVGCAAAALGVISTLAGSAMSRSPFAFLHGF